MKIIELNGNTSLVNKGFKLYINKLLKKELKFNTIYPFTFGKIEGKIKLQRRNYEAVVFGIKFSCPYKGKVWVFTFNGLCKPYNYKSKTSVYNKEDLFENM